jgi:hypothetical protein
MQHRGAERSCVAAIAIGLGVIGNGRCQSSSFEYRDRKRAPDAGQQLDGRKTLRSAAVSPWPSRCCLSGPAEHQLISSKKKEVASNQPRSPR